MNKRKTVKKTVFIMITAAVIGCGLFMYIQRHGAVNILSPQVQVSAGQAILVNGDTGRVIYEKEADQRAYPASTTKIMTALITLETMEKYKSPLQQKVRVPAEAAGVEGSSIYLKPGEEVSIEDLLYGMMLVSGNDAAVALAEIIGGSQDEFVKMMNKRAKELGCENTHFVNPNGLFDREHYTTVRDMSLIAKQVMKNKTFRKIVATKSWQASREDSDYMTFCNKNKTVFEYEGGCGIKIGYTQNSGRTLVAAAKRNGRTMICVVMSAPDWFNDAYRLMDMGFKAD